MSDSISRNQIEISEQEVETEPAATQTQIGQEAVKEAVGIIKKHLDKEARNRHVEHLDVNDLCEAQKTEMVEDLKKVFA